MESSNAGASTAGTSEFQDAWPSAYPDLGETQEYDPAYPHWIAELPVGEESYYFVHGMVESTCGCCLYLKVYEIVSVLDFSFPSFHLFSRVCG